MIDNEFIISYIKAEIGFRTNKAEIGFKKFSA
jgi:hypothetical protein